MSRRLHLTACFAVLAALATAAPPVSAQSRDSLLNGTLAGAAAGAASGVAFTHAVRDSDLAWDQYLRGALIFGAIGAGAGAGVDALLSRASGTGDPKTKRIAIHPSVWRNMAGVLVRWKW